MIPREEFLQTLMAVGVSATAVGFGTVSDDSVRSCVVGDSLVDVRRSGIRIRHRLALTRILFETPRKGFSVAARQSVASIREFGQPKGSFRITDRIVTKSALRQIDTVKQRGEAVIVSGPMTGTGEMRCEIAFTAISERQLRFDVKLLGSNAKRFNRIIMRSASSPDEAIFWSRLATDIF